MSSIDIQECLISSVSTKKDAEKFHWGFQDSPISKKQLGLESTTNCSKRLLFLFFMVKLSCSKEHWRPFYSGSVRVRKFFNMWLVVEASEERLSKVSVWNPQINRDKKALYKCKNFGSLFTYQIVFLSNWFCPDSNERERHTEIKDVGIETVKGTESKP